MNEDTPGTQKRGRVRFLWRLVGIGIVFVVFAYIGYAIYSNRSELATTLRTANLGWLAAHTVGVLCYFGLLPFVWFWIIRTTGETCSPRATLVSAYLPSLGKYVPGKLWSVASRAVLLRKLGGVSRTQATTATLLQYIFELAGAAPYLLVSACLVRLPRVNVFTVAPFIIPVVLVALFPDVALRCIGKVLRRTGWKGEIGRDGQTFSGGLFLGFIGHWGIYALSGVALCRAFGEFDGKTAVAIGCAFVAAWLLGFISLLTPGGIGVREGALVIFLTPLVGHGTAVLVPLLARIAWTLGDGLAIVIGLASLSKARDSLRCGGCLKADIGMELQAARTSYGVDDGGGAGV